MSPSPRRRSLVALGVVGGAVVGAMLAVRTPWFAQSAARLTERLASAALGEDVVIGDLEIEPARARVQLRGVVISHRSNDPAADGQAILATERAVVELGLRGWSPIARRIRVDRPVIHLHLDPDGLREFRAVERQEPAARFPWEELWVTGARFRLTAPAFSLEAAGVDLSPEGTPDTVTLDVDRLHLETARWQQDARGLVLSPVGLTPRQLDLPALDLELPVADVQGGLVVPFAGPLSGDLHIDARLDQLNGLIPAHLRLDGLGEVEVEVGGTLAAPTAVGAVLVPGGTLSRVRDGEQTLLVEAEGLASGFTFADSVLDLAPLSVDWSGGHVHGGLQLDLDVMTLAASLTAEGLSASEVFVHTGIAPEPWVDMTTDLELQLAGTMRPLHFAGSLDVAGRDLRVAGGPLTRTAPLLRLSRLSTLAELRFVDQQLFLQTASLRTASSRGRVVANLDLTDARRMDLQLDLGAVLLDELRPLAGLAPTGLAAFRGRLSGPFEAPALSGRITSEPFGLLGFTVASQLTTTIDAPTLQRIQLPDLDGRLGASDLAGRAVVDLGADPTWVDLDVALERGRLRDLVEVFVDVEGIDGDVTGGVSVRGPGEALDGTIRLELANVELFGERFDGGAADLRVVGGALAFDRVAVRRRDEGLFLRGTLARDGSLNLDVLSSRLKLEDLETLRGVQADLRGNLALTGHVGGTVQEPRPDGQLDVWGVSLGGRALGDSRIDFDTQGDTLGFSGSVAGQDVDVAGTLQLGGEVAWAVQADLHDFPAHVFYPTTPDGTPLEARVTGRMVAAGELGIAGQPFQLSARADAVALDWDTHRLRSPRPWTLKWTDSAFSLAGVELVGGRTQLAFGGARNDDGQLLLAGDGVLDLDLVRGFVPGLDRSDGTGRVEVSLEGRPGALEPIVAVAVDDATFAASYLPEPMEGTHLRLEGRATGFELQALDARMGGGALTGGGTIDAESWLPVRYDLWMKLRDGRIDWFDWLPPVSGSASLAFVGPADDPLMKGEVDVSQLIFAERIDWEDAVVSVAGDRLAGAASEASPDLFSMDIALRADDTIRVRNNLGDLTASGELRVVGDTARPGLVGDVRATPGGRVYLKEREFELQRAEIHFVEPYAFDPELDVALATEVSTLEDEYAIDYRISGPWSDWRAESTSSPALPEADINALLLFGMTRDEIERYGGALSALALEGGDLLASKFGLVETIGGGIYGLEILRPERIDIVSGVTERGSASISSELRILAEKDLDWATLILEQNLSRLSDTYIGLERRLANRLYLRGYWARQQVGRQLNTGGAWGLDFRLRWELD